MLIYNTIDAMQAPSQLHTFIKLRWPTFFGQAPKKLDKKVPYALPLAKTHLQ